MDTWTIVTTLVTGITVGFFLLAGVVWLLIRYEDNPRAEIEENRRDYANRKIGEYLDKRADEAGYVDNKPE